MNRVSILFALCLLPMFSCDCCGVCDEMGEFVELEIYKSGQEIGEYDKTSREFWFVKGRLYTLDELRMILINVHVIKD